MLHKMEDKSWLSPLNGGSSEVSCARKIGMSDSSAERSNLIMSHISSIALFGPTQDLKSIGRHHDKTKEHDFGCVDNFH